jgi:peptidoglycan/xylan/chitin deacetylase (PgdA/CDA1 family)
MKPSAFITTSWDDGHPLDLRLGELLRKYALPATFYIPLDHTLPLLSPSQVRELSTQFEVGAHTVHHCDLLTTPEDVTRMEITDCKKELEQICGRPCTAFCFPKGRFRRTHVKEVARAGYRTARTVELMSVEIPRRQDGVAIVPTTLQAGPAGFLRGARNSLKRLRPMNFFRHLRYSQFDWVRTAEAMLEQVLVSGGVFHVWGHSWEVDQMGEWQNLERVFQVLAQSKGHAVWTNNTGLADLALS